MAGSAPARCDESICLLEFSCQTFTIYHDNVNFSTVGGMSSFAFISKVAEASHRSSAEPSKAERLGHSTGRKLSDSAFRAEKRG